VDDYISFPGASRGIKFALCLSDGPTVPYFALLHHRFGGRGGPLTMANKRSPKKRRPVPKTVLRLPDLDQAKSAVLNSLSSRDAQRGYRHAMDEFIEWYCSEPRLSFNKTVVVRYRMHLESRKLSPGTVNLRLGAVRRLAYEATDCGLRSPDLAAGIRRVKGVKKLGVRLGNWLTAEQGEALWQSPDTERLKGKRDRALLAVLLACGLRRHEAVELNFSHLQQRERTLGHCRSDGKGWSHTNGAHAGLGQGRP
jgi:integrase